MAGFFQTIARAGRWPFPVTFMLAAGLAGCASHAMASDRPAGPIGLLRDGRAVEGPFQPGGRVGARRELDVQWGVAADGASAVRLAWDDPVGWTGWVWLHPDTNQWRDAASAVDLSGVTQLVVCARGDQGGEWAEFKMGLFAHPSAGGIDSAGVTSGRVRLTRDWRTYTLPLAFLDRSRIVSGFAVVLAGRARPVVIYLRDVRYE